METAAHPRTLFKPRTLGTIFVTLTSSASLRTGVVKTFRCATSSNQLDTSNTERVTPKLRISIRSILLVTFGVAPVCAMFAQIPYDTSFWPCVTIVAAWAIPSASLGYDVSPTRRGLLIGVVTGLSIGVLIYLWLSRPVIRE